jgi:hypothetical protein
MFYGSSVHAAISFIGLGRGGSNLFPSGQSLENDSGFFHRRDVTIMVLDHFDRSTHLLSKGVHVNAFKQAVCGEGMPETTSGTSFSRRTDKQL